MAHLSRRLCHALPLAVAAALAGCGDGLNLADVTGKVTLDGKPVPNAQLTFAPQGGAGSTSNGVTDAEGHYSLRFSRDRAGAFIGKHDVTIETEAVSLDEQMELAGESVAPPEFVKLPAKYASRGELVKDVAAGSNTIDFALTSE